MEYRQIWGWVITGNRHIVGKCVGPSFANLNVGDGSLDFAWAVTDNIEVQLITAHRQFEMGT
ncbi:MAG: hypothetical protein ACREU6_08450 [Steroidobacteraceae bacterium]